MKLFALATLALAYAMPAHAVVEDVVGANYSFDPGTNLYWLDPTATLGQSANEALATNAGWRHATTSELASLINGQPPLTYEAVHDFADKMGGWTGTLNTMPGGNWLYGIFDTGKGFAVGGVQAIGQYGTDGGYKFHDGNWNPIAADVGVTFNDAWRFGGEGNWLVSNVAPVPEPAEWAMMGIGIAGLGWAARRQKRKTQV